MTIPIVIKILFAFFLVDMFILTVWAAIELVDEIRKRLKETPEGDEPPRRQDAESTARGDSRPTELKR